MTNPNDVASVVLELMNGEEMLLAGIFLIWGLRYLWLEAKRRELTRSDWLHGRLPPSMDFIIAVMVFDFANWLRSLVIWSWRHIYHSGGFARWHVALLVFAGIVGAFGALCKIRSVTQPDYGNQPWLICLVLAFIFAGVTLL